MRCPYCDAEKDNLKVIDSRTCEGGRAIRRRRECLSCEKRFTTYERIEDFTRLTVVKKDGRRVPFDRQKIAASLERACHKRPIPEEVLARVVEEVEEETFRRHDREAESDFIGRLVGEKLKALDQVAYVRFASDYQEFKTLEDLMEEARAVLEATRANDPAQGRLFFDPTPRRKANAARRA